MFVLLGSGKPPLGPSVTVSCWSAVQDGLHTPARRHTHRPSCCEKTSMPNVMFQSLCQVWSVWTLHWALPYFLTLSLHCKLCWRAVTAVTTWRSKARPAWIQTNGPHLKIQQIFWQRVKSQICQLVEQRRVRQFPHLDSQKSINSLSLLHLFHLFERH